MYAILLTLAFLLCWPVGPVYQADQPQMPMGSHAVVHTMEGIYYPDDLARAQMDVRQWIDQCTEVPPAH
jgi:hypothetical protein